MISMRLSKKSKLISVLLWVLLWQLLAVLTDNSVVLAGPAETMKTLFRLLLEAEFQSSVLCSLGRIGTGFLLAAVSGIALGTAAFWNRGLAAFFYPPVALMKSVPVASFVILAIIWLGGSERLSTFVSFVVVFPMVYLSTQSGLWSADPKLLEMAEVFRLGRKKKLRYLYLPALWPYLLNCFQTAFAMAWKSGIAAELIGQPRHTIGNNLYQAKIFLDTPALFAWTFSIIALSMILEKALLSLMERIGVAFGGAREKEERTQR